MTRREHFQRELAALVNAHNLDGDLHTPDFIIAEMLCEQIETFRQTNLKAQAWRVGNQSHPHKCEHVEGSTVCTICGT